MLWKKKLILLPFILGLFLIFYSWSISYPISTDSPSDFLYNHISPFYWLGLVIVYPSLYIMGFLFKWNSLKWIVALGIVTFIHSSVYFYWSIPGSDSHYFRGLTEYFVETGDLDPSKAYHSYFQWPLFFVLEKVAYTLGVNLRFFEFALFAILGFLYTTSLYYLFHRFSKYGAHLAVISYFILMTYYLNYQFAPFSLAFALLLILFMLDSHEYSSSAMVLTKLIIFTAITLIHSFTPVFFISYVLLKFFFSKDRQYVRLFQITSMIFLSVLTLRAVFFLPMALEELLGLQSTVYVRFSETLFIQATTPIDELAQNIGRIVLISTGLVTGSGFIILFLKRKIGKINLALFFSGIIYVIASTVLPILGTRAFAILGIPLSLGIIYFLKTRFRIVFQCLFLILITLFAFVPLHSSFSSTRSQLMFQTEENYQCANFWIDYYSPDEPRLMGTDPQTAWYLVTKLRSPNVSFEINFFNRNITDYDCILFTISLESSVLRYNYKMEEITRETNKLSTVYDSGNALIFSKNDN